MNSRVRNRLLRGLLSSLLFLTILEGMGLADVIRMRDGSVLRGKVISFREQKFTIVVRIGGAEAQYIIPLEEVESINFEDESTSDREEPRSGGAEPLSGNRTVGGGARRNPAPEMAERAAPPPASSSDSASPVRERQTGVAATNVVIVEKTVTVPAAADWTSTEIRVQRGQRIVINARGEVDLGEGRRTGPGGKSDLTDSRRPMPDKPTGGLVAVIGDDNDDYQFVGASTEFYAPHSGIIFLLLNERSAQDNSGSFIAQVKVMSNR